MRTEPTASGILRAALAMLVVACAYFAWVGWNEPRWTTPEPTGHHLPLYGRSLLEGHAWVMPAPPEMRRLPDPWDPEQYRGLAVFDLSYWDGHFYSYFGVVPAATLFAPWTALAGTYLTEAFAAALYASAGFAVAFGLLLAVVVGLVIGRRIVDGARAADPALAAPVTVYIVLLSLMAVVAIGTGRPAAIVGGIAFVASDSMLGWSRFVVASGRSRLPVMVTYHVAQIGLVLALI